MTDAELKDVYTLCCDTKGYEINPGQIKAWKAALGFYDARDLEAAVRNWYNSNSEFPMPAQLRPLAESARRLRVIPKTGYEYTTGYRCPRCKTTMTSFDPAREVKCEKCWRDKQYSIMSVELQERKMRGTEVWESISPAPTTADEYSGREGAF